MCSPRYAAALRQCAGNKKKEQCCRWGAVWFQLRGGDVRNGGEKGRHGPCVHVWLMVSVCAVADWATCTSLLFGLLMACTNPIVGSVQRTCITTCMCDVQEAPPFKLIHTGACLGGSVHKRKVWRPAWNLCRMSLPSSLLPFCRSSFTCTVQSKEMKHKR